MVLISFAPKGEALLLGLGLVTPGKVLLRTHEGKNDPEKFSCFRADDGCKPDGSSFRVPFVLRRGTELELFSLWDAPEGQNIELLAQKGAALAPSLAASRYWSPE